MSMLRSRLSYANVVATLCLVALVLGTDAASGAARFITGLQIKDGSLTSADVADHSLQARDFKAGQLPAGPSGESGAQGPPGADGRDGTNGANGTNGTNGANGTNGTGFRWRGAFDCQGGLYAPNDVVSYAGSTWINGSSNMIGGCVQPPFDPWQKMASKGDAGPLLDSLPAGYQVEGHVSYGVSAGDTESDTIVFPFPVTTSQGVRFNPQTGCNGGTFEVPAADAGYLCIWARSGTDANPNMNIQVVDPDAQTAFMNAQLHNTGSPNVWTTPWTGTKSGFGVVLSNNSSGFETVTIGWALRA